MRHTAWLTNGIAAIVAALILGVSPARAEVTELPSGGEQRVDTYLQAFLQMTFWPSDTFSTKSEQRPAVEKLGPTVRVRLKASGYEEFGRKLLREEAAITGLDIVFLYQDDKSEDLLIEINHFTDRRTGHKTCDTYADVGDQGQPRIHVAMDALTTVKKNTAGQFGCFNRETMRALGFGYDHDHPTVMSDAYSKWYLTDIDQMMMRTLYDPRVKPGMHWLGALAAARGAVVDSLIANGAPADTAGMGRQWVAKFTQLMIAQAEAGQANFQTQLGFAYTYGEAPEYLPQNLVAGYDWFHRAAEAGDTEAQAQVGDSLIHGRGVAANRDEGLRWLRLAAEHGHLEAQRNLALVENMANATR